VQCACKPKDGRQLPEKIDGPCPLGVQHPPSGEEFALGCGLCRNIKDF
jgi:E3 ubiquitin-protein ligase MYCBP2